MRRRVLIFWMIALAASPAWAGKETKISYFKKGDHVFSIKRTDRAFIYVAGADVWSFAIRDCNKQTVDSFFARYAAYRSEASQARQLKAGEAVLVENGRKFLIQYASRSSRYLQTVPSEAAILRLAQKEECRRQARKPAQADPTDVTAFGIPAIIERLNSPQTAKMSPNEKCPSCEWQRKLESGDFARDVQSCIAEVCRDSWRQLPDPERDGEAAIRALDDQKLKLEFDRDVAPLLEEMGKRLMDYQRASVKRAMGLLDRPPGEIRDLESLRFYELIQARLTRAATMQDERRSKSDLAKALSAGEKREILDLETWRSQNDLPTHFDGRHGMEIINERVSGVTTAREAVKQFASDLRKRIDRVKSEKIVGRGQTPESLLPGVSYTLIRRAASSGDLDPVELEELVHADEQVGRLNATLLNPDYRARLQEFIRRHLADPRRREQLKTELQNDLNDLTTHPPEDLKGAPDQCRRALAVRIAKAPSRQQLAEAKRTEREVRATFAKNVFARFSKETAAGLKSASRDWSFKYPEPKESLVGQMKLAAKERNLWSQKLAPTTSPDYFGEIASDVRHFCSSQAGEVQPPPDHASTTGGAMLLPASDLRSPAAAAGAISHELGHKVSAHFKGDPDGSARRSEASQKLADEARACVARKHAGEPRDHADADLADAFAAAATAGKATNPACGSFSARAGANVNNLDLFQTGESDHSTPLFRLLQAESLRAGGQLPKTCQSMLKDHGLNADFNRCF